MRIIHKKDIRSLRGLDESIQKDQENTQSVHAFRLRVKGLAFRESGPYLYLARSILSV